ncbi:hypothetical protein [Gordonia sp. (in: high G+C Gram-positive bacteria)]|uniref:hypothetical protein n=1 Tax=Gordonia sp. (in: high G+C Gram-positive bacteria) TaxID=84139 RepID=UPI003529C82D
MRSFLTGILVAVAGIAMIIAVPTMWSTVTVVSANGFTDAAAHAAEKPQVQEYFADKIADEVSAATDIPLTASVVKPLATQYTQSPQFVTDFTEIARQQHAWLFTEPGPRTSLHEMDLDITPMVNSALLDAPIQLHLDRQIIVPVDQNRLTAGSMEQTGKQLTVAAWASVIVAAIAGILALVLGRNRAAVIAWLGIDAFAAGVIGALIATYLQRRAADSVSASDLSTQQTVKVVAGDILHQLTVTSLITGGVGLLVALLGVIATVALRRRA